MLRFLWDFFVAVAIFTLTLIFPTNALLASFRFRASFEVFVALFVCVLPQEMRE
jgi:hypothetical protein